MINRLFTSLTIVLLMLVITGCPKPDLMAPKFLDTASRDSLLIEALDPVVRKNDILYINVSAAGSENAQRLADLYNQKLPGAATSNLALTGYLVSPKGTITMPNVGEIKVAGLTKQQVHDQLFGVLKKFFEGIPIISIRIINYTVYVNGEVDRPSAINVPNEVITLPQAITLAGGFTVYAAKEKVQLIREGDDGKKKIVHLDLRKDDLLEKDKEYYYLKQNDIIFIEATKEKGLSANQSTTRTVGYATGAITILLTLLNIFRQN
jgi:polysaccharide biosynthesis/export protein